VVDLSQGIAGPFCTKLLAACGGTSGFPTGMALLLERPELIGHSLLAASADQIWWLILTPMSVDPAPNASTKHITCVYNPREITGGLCVKPRQASVRINVLLPAGLVEDLREFVSERGRSRFIAEVLEREVERRRLRAAIADAAGAWSDADHPKLADGPAIDRWIAEGRRHPVRDRELGL
jgi:hypothetical protein